MHRRISSGAARTKDSVLFRVDDRQAPGTRARRDGGCIYETMYCADLIRLKVHRAVEDGTYELVFRNPAVARGWHQVEVELVGRPGTPLFHRWYRD